MKIEGFLLCIDSYKTNSLNNLLAVSSKLLESPGCGLEVCITELLMAVSHLKRSGTSIAAIGPPSFAPSAIFWKESKLSSNCTKSISEQKHCSFTTLRWYNTFINRDLLQNKMMPTFTNSSRSTLGVTRITAYSYRFLSCILSFFYKDFRICQSCKQEIGIYFFYCFRTLLGVFPMQPSFGDQIDNFLDFFPG